MGDGRLEGGLRAGVGVELDEAGGNWGCGGSGLDGGGGRVIGG